MKLRNTPWKYEAHADGTCEIYATDKRRETGLRWIGAAIDEPTALAIAALPDTLEELERVKEVLKTYNKAAEKFISKVDLGQARSKTTYSELKHALSLSKKALEE